MKLSPAALAVLVSAATDGDVPKGTQPATLKVLAKSGLITTRTHRTLVRGYMPSFTVKQVFGSVTTAGYALVVGK